jgi:membrane-bound lytic murein transglycosylase A
MRRFLCLALIATACGDSDSARAPEPLLPACVGASDTPTASPGVPAPEPEAELTLLGWDEVPELQDGGDRASLLAAARATLRWFQEPPPEFVGKQDLRVGTVQVPAAAARQLLEQFVALLDSPVSDAEVLTFVKERFRPYEYRNGEARKPLFTGYYVPLIEVSRERTDEFRHPIYRAPDDLVVLRRGDFAANYQEAVEVSGFVYDGVAHPEPPADPAVPRRPFHADLRTIDGALGRKVVRGRVNERGEFVAYYQTGEIRRGALAGRGLELAWTNDEVGHIFAQVQGSTQARYPDGETRIFHYAGGNGRPYRPIGKIFRDCYGHDAGPITMDFIRDQLRPDSAFRRRHADGYDHVLDSNPSWVFFEDSDAAYGSTQLPVLPLRSAAVDADYYPYGSLLFVDVPRPAKDPAGAVVPRADAAIRRLFFSHDTGGAITSAYRLDIFWGFGEEAGREAGMMKLRGRLLLLLPHLP